MLALKAKFLATSLVEWDVNFVSQSVIALICCGSALYLVELNICHRRLASNIFDAVGWAAGRASGL